MAGLDDSDYYIQRVVRSTLLRNPAGSYDDVLAAWIRARARPLGESDSQRVLAAYEAEQSIRHSPSDAERRSKGWSFLDTVPLYLVVGIAAMFAIGSALMGPANVLGALALAVICTAGAALVPLVVVAWVVGCVVVEVYRALTSAWT